MTPQPHCELEDICTIYLADPMRAFEERPCSALTCKHDTRTSRPATSPTTYDHDVIGDILRSHSSPASIVQYESWISGMKYTDIKAAGTVAAIWIGDLRYLLDEEAERKRNKSLRTGGEPR